MSVDEINALVAPHPESVDAVTDWLASHGLVEDALVRSAANDWVKIKVPVSVAESMMDTVCILFQRCAALILKQNN